MSHDLVYEAAVVTKMSSSTNDTLTPAELYAEWAAWSPLIWSYFVLYIPSFVINSVVIVILRDQVRSQSRNLFYLNLMLADALILWNGIFTSIFQLVSIYGNVDHTYNPVWLETLNDLALRLGESTIMLTIVWTSVDRYYAICRVSHVM